MRGSAPSLPYVQSQRGGKLRGSKLRTETTLYFTTLKE
jgi:hypothetical protein